MTSVTVRRLIVLTLCAGFAAASHHAQAPVSQTVDFVAVSADGSPVLDLAPGQITVKVDGKERAVKSLELVKYGSAINPLPLPFASNAAADASRAFVLVVDEESMAPGTENPLRQALLAFGTAVPAGDRIGLFTIPRGSQSVAPTTDRAKFKDAVAAIQGRMSMTSTARAASQANAGCHGRDVVMALSSIVNATSRPAGPTPIVFFSVGVAGPDTSITGMVSGTSQQSVLNSQECKLTTREFQALGQATDSARAQVFVVRPEEAEAMGRSEGLETIAGVTGGQMLPVGGASGGAMVRIARETSAYYVATVAIENNERNGLSHRLEVKSTRPEVTVRSRPSVLVAKAAGGAMSPQNMLRTAEVHTGFGLRSLVVASRNDGDTKNGVKLVALAEPVDPTVKVAAAAAGVYDTTGKLVAQWTAKPEELQRALFAGALVVPAGAYRVRVAAVDGQGRMATSDYDINAEMVSAGVAHLGGLLVGTANPSFMPQLQFSNEAEVTVYFELYGRPAAQFGSLVELAETVEGPALTSVQPTPSATPVQDKFLFTAKLPIASLKPGDYLVRAKIAFEGQPTGVLLRTIRKR